ncbi:MAG: tetratricopeptide repeat protein [Desulfobacterales bacterium]|nr:tetratricopeptide repeat protein [Desulfobacterales bacterium]
MLNSWNIKKRQYITFFILLVITACLSCSMYYLLKQKWIFYRNGEKFYALKDFSKAIVYYKQSIKLGLTNKNAFAHLADAYIFTQQIEEALYVYKNMFDMYPDQLFAQLKIAEILGQMKQYDESIKQYRHILYKYPNYRNARFYLARVLTWSGRFEEAVKEYRLFLELR